MASVFHSAGEAQSPHLCHLNRTTKDSYTSSLVIDSGSVRPERSAAKSKAAELAPSLLFDLAARAATLRANGQWSAKLSGSCCSWLNWTRSRSLCQVQWCI